MKRITLLMVCFYSFVCNAQLTEGFEGTTLPVSGTWTLGSGAWAVFDNGIGTFNTWTVNSGDAVPPLVFEGENAAFMNARQDNLGAGNTSQDWLVSPAVTVPANGQLRFQTRQSMSNDQGSIYQVRISTTSQTNPASFTVLGQWDETTLNANYNVYEEKVLPLGLPEGTTVYIAFVMVVTQPGAGIIGDRWFVDAVKVREQCLDPLNLTAGGITATTANLSWDNPSGATSWEIEIIPESTATPTGHGIVYNGTLPYVATGTATQDPLVQAPFEPEMEYKYYVRALCGNGLMSAWVGPYTFEMFPVGESCGSAIAIGGLPYSTEDDTENYGDNFDQYPGTGCGTEDNYMQGNEVFYTYTATEDGIISVTMDPTEGYTGVFVYNGCDNVGVSCIAGIADSSAGVKEIPAVSVTAGETYIIVVSSLFSQTTGYNLTIQEVNCAPPTALDVSDASTTGFNVSWTEVGTATSWEYVMQAPGTGIPTGSGTTINTTSYNPTGLPASTGYEFYVRSDCGDGTFSAWTGPVLANTLCEPFNVPFFEGFNTNSTNEFCWTVLNINDDERAWNMDFEEETFEGNQVAVFDTGLTNQNNDMLVSPPINLTGNQRLKYRYKLSNELDPMEFKVMLSTTGLDPEDFTTELVPLQIYSNGEYLEKIVNLSTIPAGTVYIAWYVPGSYPAGFRLFLDNVIIEEQPPCSEPNDLMAGNFTSESAQLSWQPGNTETAWEVIVQNPGGPVPTEASTGIPAGNPYTKTGLDANTTYEYYVRSVCGGTNGNSIWSGPYSFTTACAAFDVPFFEGFNTDSPSEVCWTILNENDDSTVWSMNGFLPFEGDENAQVYTGNSENNEWIISPPINLTGNQRLKFHYKAGSVWQGESLAGFRLMVSTTGTAPEDFIYELLPETGYVNTNYLKKIVDLTGQPYSSSTVHFAWHIPSTFVGNTDIYIDNVIVEDIPACPEPLDLAVANITQTTAELSWTAGNSETSWQIVVQPAGTGLPTEAGIVTTNPYTATNLDPATTYEFYVRAVCGGDEESIWSDPITFTTLITNDECETATVVPVNEGDECTVFASGTLFGATGSPVLDECGYGETAADDDVWFQFTATETTHSVSLIDIAGLDTTLVLAIYEGADCSNLTQMGLCLSASPFDFSTKVLTALTIGETYFIRVFSPYSTGPETTFNVCVKGHAPPILPDTTQYTVEELVTDVLIGSDCAQVSNITWSTGTDYGTVNGIGSFVKNGSDFPFEGGIVLTTGDALRVSGPNFELLGDGVDEWPGDGDLEAIILEGTGEEMVSLNATVLEFDFVPLIPTMSFDFLFASEEYGGFQCSFSDSFAFILTDQNGVSTNLAVVPNTDIPVSVVTIRDQANNDTCDSANPEYFGQYNEDNGAEDLASINFNGQTTVLQASAQVVPGTQYHIKMVIADRLDSSYDSAVFLAAGSFNIGNVDLGVDLVVEDNNAVCYGEDHTIQSGLDANSYTFQWSRNGEEIAGETGPNLTVSTAGEYTIQANLAGFSCGASDSIIIEFFEQVAAGNTPNDLSVCGTDSETAAFDLSQNDAVILQGLNPADYVVTYHATSQEATDDTAPIGPSYTNTSNPQTVFARVENMAGCFSIFDFELSLNNLQFTLTPDFSICSGNTGTITATPTNVNASLVTYSWTQDGNPLADTGSTITVTEGGVYEVTVSNAGCSSTDSVTVTEVAAPVADAPSDASACQSYVLPALTAGDYYTGPGGTGTQLAEGSTVASTQLIYVYASNGTDCTDENSFTVTIVPAVQAIVDGGCQDNAYIMEALPVADSYDPSSVSYSWALASAPDTELGTGQSLTVAESGEYLVTITTASPESCTGTFGFTASGTACQIQKGISPNGDGKNDSFDLSGLQVRKISIFNRYGTEVYGYRNYTDQWHGQSDGGDELPDGTYYYMFEREGGESKTGWIYINRQRD